MTWRGFAGSGWPRRPPESEIGATMSQSALGSWTFRSIAGLVLLTTGVAGTHSSSAETDRYSHRMVESSECRGEHDDDGHGDRGHDSRRHDGDHGHNGHHGHAGGAGLGLQQVISVRILPTIFLRVDKAGRVTAAATNTGCQPGKQDDVFLLRPNGVIEPTTMLHVDRCDWTGDFTVPGRFQPQWCSAGLHRHRVDQFGSVAFESVVVVDR